MSWIQGEVVGRMLVSDRTCCPPFRPTLPCASSRRTSWRGCVLPYPGSPGTTTPSLPPSRKLASRAGTGCTAATTATSPPAARFTHVLYALWTFYLQVFHVCVEDDFGGRAYSFLCPNGTLFRQELQICEWWFNVDCGRSEEFYPGAPPPGDLQEGLGNLGGLFVEEELPPPEPLLTTLEDLLDPSFARSESRPEEQRQSRNRGGRNRGGRSRKGSSRGGRSRKGSRGSSRQNRRKARQGRRQPRQQPQPYYGEYGNYDEYGRFYPYTEDHSVDYYY